MFKANAQDPDLAEFDASRRSVPYATGFAYDMHRKGMNVALFKKLNNYWINELRTILLLEADANMNYKQMARDLMWFAELEDVLPPDIGGGRKKHRCVEVSLNHRLTCDNLRQKKKAAILSSTDAKGCFDRLVHVIASICFRRFGCPAKPVQSMITAIQTMTHFIRTAFGDSDLNYGPEDGLPPLMGLLQGNGAAMAGYALIAATIVDMMKEAGFGMDMWSPISKRVIKLLSFQMVDDATIVHGGPTNFTSGEEIFATMQDLLNHWEGGLHTAGGTIATDKSYWHLIDFKWTGGKWKYRGLDEVPGDLTITGPNGTPVVIPRLDVTESKELLGLMIRPDGKESDQVKHLRQKTKAWADKV